MGSVGSGHTKWTYGQLRSNRRREIAQRLVTCISATLCTRDATFWEMPVNQVAFFRKTDASVANPRIEDG